MSQRETLRLVDATVDARTYPAIERTMMDKIGDGSADPTIMSWTFGDELFLSVGPIQDAGLIDTDQASEYGMPYSRRYNMAGSVGFFQTDHTPTLYTFFPDQGKRTLSEVIALAGESMVDALTEAGIERAYYEGGDIELEPEDGDKRATKIGVAGCGWDNGVWAVFTNVINKTFSPEEFEMIDELIGLPKVKFEDKDTDSVAGRMGSMEDEAPGVDIDNVLNTAAENIADRIGMTLSDGELTTDERERIDEHAEFYGSQEWFQGVSTANLVADAANEDRIAEVAYKARKLVKASVVVDPDDEIVDAMYTGDMYHKPRVEALERLNEAITGVEVTDEGRLLEELERVFASDEFEVPWMSADDFLQPLKRVPGNLVSVDEFERK